MVGRKFGSWWDFLNTPPEVIEIASKEIQQSIEDNKKFISIDAVELFQGIAKAFGGGSNS